MTSEQRAEATVLYESLLWARDSVQQGNRGVQELRKGIEEVILKAPSAEIDYIEVISWETLEALDQIIGKVIIALAVWIGQTRLIDNIVIEDL